MTVVDAESRFHVLAVDDSIVDRKLIEMLLKNSSYQGEPPPRRHLAAPQPEQDRDSVCPSCPCFLE
jgi:ferredoxin-thioredoxin reductase catalytic subunit